MLPDTCLAAQGTGVGFSRDAQLLPAFVFQGDRPHAVPCGKPSPLHSASKAIAASPVLPRAAPVSLQP